MPPRIIESDEEQDELASASDDSYNDINHTATRSAPGRQASSSSARRIRIAAPVAARPAARAAAVRANESMDTADVVDSDEDEGEEVDELAEEDENEDGDDAQAYDDAEGEEYEDYDTSMQDQYPSPSTSTSTAANPVKIKLKLGNNDANNGPSSPAMPPTVISLRGSGSGRGKGAAPSANKKGKAPAAARPKPAAKRKHSEMEEFDDMEDDQPDAPEGEEDDEEDFMSDNSQSSSMSITKMTARQRAAAVGAEPELMSLPSAPSKKKILTEDEVAMRKVETSRRRKHLLNKKLEEEKQETIERLLKKPIGRRGGASTSRIAAATKVDRSSTLLPIPSGGVDENGQAIPPSSDLLQGRLPTMLRWVSSIKDGIYNEVWAVPVDLEEKYAWPTAAGGKVKIEEMDAGKSKEIKYPPPRPPPKTRLLNKAAEVAATA